MVFGIGIGIGIGIGNFDLNDGIVNDVTIHGTMDERIIPGPQIFFIFIVSSYQSSFRLSEDAVLVTVQFPKLLL